MRSEEEILGVIARKAAAIRRRRQRVLSGSAIAIVAVGSLAALALLRDPGTTIVTDRPLAASDVADVAPASSTSAPSDPTTTLPQHDISPTSAPATQRTAAASTTTAPPVAEVPLCGPSEVDVAVRPDRSTYTAGETVTVEATAVNRSGHSCRAPEAREVLVGRTDDGSGPVAQAAGSSQGDEWADGEAITIRLVWDDASGTPRSPGSYEARATFTLGDGEAYTGAAAFTITE